MPDQSKPRVIAIVGATATGKTDAAEAVAARLGVEIVCADSRQVFAELEIGTGKPSPAERASRPHHLFDALSLAGSAGDSRASAGWYARSAARVMSEIHARGGASLLVGGSGLYLKALASGLSAEPPRAPEVRARLMAELAAEGPEALHRRLAACDPETAARLAPRDGQRITRALEVFESSGRPLSSWHGLPPRAPFVAEWRTIEITLPSSALEPRIADRTRTMFASGLIEEVSALETAGLEAPLRRLRAVGYDEALGLIGGRLSRDEAERRTNLRTRQLAKRQRTWFRHQVDAVRIAGETLQPEALARAVLDAARSW